MPDFSNPFEGNNLNRPLTVDEAIRAFRFAVAAEYEAIQLYEQMANAIPDPDLKALLKDVAEEEIVHAGEFLHAIKRLRPEESKSYTEGEQEASKLMKKTASTKKAAIIPKRPIKTAGFLDQFKTLLKNIGGAAKSIAENLMPMKKDDAISATLETIGKYGRPAIEQSLDKLFATAETIQAAGMPSKEEVSKLLSAVSSLIDKNAENEIRSKAPWLIEKVKEMRNIKANTVLSSSYNLTTKLDLIASEIQKQDPKIAMAIDKISDQLENCHRPH